MLVERLSLSKSLLSRREPDLRQRLAGAPLGPGAVTMMGSNRSGLRHRRPCGSGVNDPRTDRFTWTTHKRYRTAEERKFVELLVLSGWSFEYQAGEAGLDDRAAEAVERLVALGLPFRGTARDRRSTPSRRSTS